MLKKPDEMKVSVFDLKDMHERGEIRFDLAIQRNEVWKDDKKKARKSLFIHSLIFGYPVPVFFAQNCGDSQLWLLDGKQRMTTTLQFINNKFALDERTPVVKNANIKIKNPETGKMELHKDVVIAGKFFDGLPPEFRKSIENYHFTILKYAEIIDDERDEIFSRINSSVPLSKVETNRVVAGEKTMKDIQEITNHPFFAKCVNLNESGRNRFLDEELVMQIIMLFDNNCEAVSFEGDTMTNFCEHSRGLGVNPDTKKKLLEISDYVLKAIPYKENFLRKTHTAMIIFIAQQAMAENIAPEKFGGWVKKYWNNLPTQYSDTTKAGSAKKDQVSKRLAIVARDYKETIAQAKDYVPPKKVLEELKAIEEAKAKLEAEAKAKAEAEANGTAQGENVPAEGGEANPAVNEEILTNETKDEVTSQTA